MVISNPSISIKVIFEDESIIVLDKPSDMPVYNTKKGKEDTIINWLTKKWPKAEPVHRLDNDTSGLLLIAKNNESHENLRRQFNEGNILKRYIALVLGEAPPEGVIDAPIAHDPKSQKRMCVVQCLPIGKRQEAYTSYKLLKKYLGGQYSLLEVTIKTGVRHQIRVHLASIGHPITGDRLYQNARQHARDKTNLSRQFLHATKIGFNHPKDGRWVEYSSPLPEDLRNVLTKLEKV